jgi:hypothetical protein
MNSAELAAYVQATATVAERRSIVKKAQSRILGVGHEQYAQQERQKFESVSIDDLLELSEEELLDQINYAVMGIIRLRRLRFALSKTREGFVLAFEAEYMGRKP